MSKINVSILNELNNTIPTKDSGKKCIIQQIIERFPKENQKQISDILENKEKYTTMASMKILRQTGIKNGSADSLKKHRRNECLCYV